MTSRVVAAVVEPVGTLAGVKQVCGDTICDTNERCDTTETKMTTKYKCVCRPGANCKHGNATGYVSPRTVLTVGQTKRTQTTKQQRGHQ